jgi:hypothetical protein
LDLTPGGDIKERRREENQRLQSTEKFRRVGP